MLSRVGDEFPPAALVVNALIHATEDLVLDMINCSKVPPLQFAEAVDGFYDPACAVLAAAKAVLADDGAGIDPTWRGAALDAAWKAVADASVWMRSHGRDPTLADRLDAQAPEKGF